jgi:glucose dehydrogenase
MARPTAAFLSVLFFTLLSALATAQPIGAFRLDTGEPVWRFHTFPTRDELGSEIWSATEALTAGGAVWTPFSLDANEGRVYIATGNPAPDYYGDVRHGDNLYTNSLVVLDARTGKLVWYHQATPHDTHDWDLTQASPLFTADVKGQSRMLATVTGKDGLLRVLDRETRELIYEVAVTRRENTTAPVPIEGVQPVPGPSAVCSGMALRSARGPTCSMSLPLTGAAHIRRPKSCATSRSGFIWAGHSSLTRWTKCTAG